MEAKEPDGSDSKEKEKEIVKANRPKAIVVVAAICHGMMSLTSKKQSDAPEMGRKRVPGSSGERRSEAASADAGDGGSAESEDKKSDGIGDEPSDAESGRVIFPNQQGDLEKLGVDQTTKRRHGYVYGRAMKMIISSELNCRPAIVRMSARDFMGGLSTHRSSSETFCRFAERVPHVR